MGKVDKHGLKITGLKAASGRTCACSPYETGYYEVFYDRESGKVWSLYRYSTGFNCHVENRQAHVLSVCQTKKHLTMQEIADCIAEEVKRDVSL